MYFVKKMVENFAKTIRLDADGLYAAAEAKIDFKSCPGRLILTPHVGEFARLTGLSASEIEEKRIDAASDFSKKNRLVLVLKGAPTVIGLPDGRSYVNTTGNPALACPLGDGRYADRCHRRDGGAGHEPVFLGSGRRLSSRPCRRSGGRNDAGGLPRDRSGTPPSKGKGADH